MARARNDLQAKESELHKLRVEAQSGKGALSRQGEELEVLQRRLSEQVAES